MSGREGWRTSWLVEGVSRWVELMEDSQEQNPAARGAAGTLTRGVTG